MNVNKYLVHFLVKHNRNLQNAQYMLWQDACLCVLLHIFSKLKNIRIIASTNFNAQFLFVNNVCYIIILNMSALNQCTGQTCTESEDTRCCVNTIFPPEDGHVNAQNVKDNNVTNIVNE